MNRRKFLQGASALAIAPTLPAIAKAAPVVGMDLAKPGSDYTSIVIMNPRRHGLTEFMRLQDELRAELMRTFLQDKPELGEVIMPETMEPGATGKLKPYVAK